MGNRNKYIVSYLKAIYGENATKENDFGYSWLPKLDEGMNASWLMLFDKMYGINSKGSLPGDESRLFERRRSKMREALGKLKWMVNVNLFDNETASFWRGPGMNPKDIQTEVFLLPCARRSRRKEASPIPAVAQWRYKAIEPLGQSMPDAEIMNELISGSRNSTRRKRGVPDPILKLTWDYGESERQGKVKQWTSTRWPRRSTAITSKMCTTRRSTPPSSSARKATGPEFPQPAGRRNDLLRQLALRRELHPEGGKVVNMMARRGKEDPTGLGLYPAGHGLAGEQEDYLQPGLGRSQRKSLGPEAGAAQMETGERGNRRHRPDGKAISPTGRPRRWQMKRTGNFPSS